MKNNKIDLKKLSKELGTQLHKSDKGLAEYVKLRGPKVKGIIYDDGSGGLTLKVPGLDCFISHGKVIEQIKEIEDKIAAYVALKPDLKRFKQALKKSETIIPEKGKRNVTRSPKKSS